ncbi:MAG: hypothetical protein ACOX46_10285 [Limnochordia bacterium]|jgi:RimJ/RimL family protein N-acetyltransferase|nr:hypothetical protein [Bacillota bacterium]HBG09355.1 hypothetical protein [Bacillota bacterium]HOA36315.1 hypothetical protein [Bacillota bacterium]
MYTGEKVRLREYGREDAPQAQAYVNSPEIKRLMAGSPFLVTSWEEEQFIEGLSARKDTYSFAIETLPEPKESTGDWALGNRGACARNGFVKAMGLLREEYAEMQKESL